MYRNSIRYGAGLNKLNNRSAMTISRGNGFSGCMESEVPQKLLSVVIVNYNYGLYLEDAILSVLSQNCDEVELVVVDGGSTDGSVDIIHKYADRLGWWCSERDNGQSDAFNKGFSHAKGKYLTWLNSDDIFVRGSLCKIVSELRKHADCEWFTGNSVRFFNGGKVYQIWWGPHIYPRFLQRKNSPIAIFGPASIFSKRVFDQVGGMNIRYHYAMDTDLWVRFCVLGVAQRRINCFCWGFRMHEASKTAEFGEHRLSQVAADKLHAEVNESYEKWGYSCSRYLRFAMYMVRLVDFSFVRLIAYKLFLRRFHG